MPQASRITSWSTSRETDARNAIGVHAVASPSRRGRRRAESGHARPGRYQARRGDRRPAPATAQRGDAAGEPNHQLTDLAEDRRRQRDRRPRRRDPFEAMPQASRITSWSTSRETDARNAIGVHAVARPSRRGRRRAESGHARPGRYQARRGDRRPAPATAQRGDAAGEQNHQLTDFAEDRRRQRDRRPRRRDPFEAMPQASRITSLAGVQRGNAIGVHAVASRSRRCRRRAESPAGRPRGRPTPATQSASTPSRAVRGDAAGEPNRQLADRAGDGRWKCDRRPRRREPFEAMPQASQITSWSTWRESSAGNAIGVHAVATRSRRSRRPAESRAGRTDGRPAPATRSTSSRREPFDAMPQASRIMSWATWRETGTGNVIGVHAVTSRSRRCRRRAESLAGRPDGRPAPAT